MFSRREREYLQRLADGLADRPDASGRPLSPGYRRKLLWSIRRKASRAISDWELYLSAVRREPRVLAPPPPEGGASIPLYTEPFVTLIRGMRSTLGLAARRGQKPRARER